jgi:hypothetical protein
LLKLAGEEKLGYELYTACLHGDLAQVKEICGKLSTRDQKTNAIVNFQLNGWTPLGTTAMGIGLFFFCISSYLAFMFLLCLHFSLL